MLGFTFNMELACAQSNHDLLAPVVSMYPQPTDGIPAYAMAAVTEDGKLKISTSVTITKSDPDGDPAMKPLNYTVTIPYLETTRIDGKNVVEQKFRIETKTRMVPGNLKSTKEEINKSTELAKHSFQLIDGTKLSVDQARKKLAGRTPVLLLTEGETINPFFQAIVTVSYTHLTLPTICSV